MRIYLFFVFVLLAKSISSQTVSVASKYAATILADDLKKHVYQLASPAFEGRETGTPGNAKAGRYIADQFILDGIIPIAGHDDYFQNLTFSRIQWKQNDLTFSGNKQAHLKDFLSIPQYCPDSASNVNIKSLMFLGYGIDDPAYSDYKGKNVKGQHLIVFSGEPVKNGKSVITGTDSLSGWWSEPLKKIQAAKDAGAASIWIVEDDFEDLMGFARSTYLTGKMFMGSPNEIAAHFIPHAFITTALGEKIMGDKKNKILGLRTKMNKSGKSSSLNIPTDIRWKYVHQNDRTEGRNVLGFIEGTDPGMKDQVVVVSAHYDHLGKRGEEIFFGADDNASGTSAVLEIAQAMQQAKKDGAGPRRSVLCMLATGEEKGLLGSEYYSEHPVFPLKNTVADVNIDMIGRMDTFHVQPNYTYVIGSNRLSTDLHRINEAMNQEYTHLDLDYTYNADDDPNRFYYRSDHYNFAKNGIPAIFFFSGVHADYHRPTDTPDKIMFDKAAKIAQLAFYTAWELANRDQRIRVDVTGRS